MTTNLTEWKYGKTTGFINKTILKRDLARGVRFLNESAYNKNWGVTKFSALFCLELKKYIDFSLVYRVDLKLSSKHWYTVRLFTKDGYVIQLKGFSFGYYGEGSRGTLAILQECGFSKEQINRIFIPNHADNKQMRLFRRVAM